MAVGRFVTAANEVIVGGFWREHAKGDLKTRKNHEILRFLSPCWEKRYMASVFYAKIRAGTAERAHKSLFGPVLRLPQVFVLHGSGLNVQQGCGNTANIWICDTSALDPRGINGISSIDEIWRTLVDGEESPKRGNLLVEVHGWAEDVVGGVSLDAKSTPDRRRKESQD